MDYEFITSPNRASEVAVSLRQEKVIALDTETTGLDRHVDKVILLSLSTRKNTYLFDVRQTGLEMFREIFEDESIAKIGFNLAFDYQMIKGTGGIDLEGNRDLMLAEYCLMSGVQFFGFSLEAVTKKYIGKERDKTLQKSFIKHTGPFTGEQLEYAAQDTSDLFSIAEAMQKEMQEAGVMRAWGVENRSLPAWADLQFYGQKIDIDQWKVIMESNLRKMGEERLNLDVFFDPFFDRDLFGKLDINYNSQPTVLYGLKKMGIKVDGDIIKNTGKETQKKIKHEAVIIALGKYREATKAYGTYGQSFLDAIHPVTGRVHPKFNQYGAETGRPTCSEGLNLLNIPRDVRYRNAFVTDWDRMISTVDYSGAELRILADLSNDPLMVRGFNSGEDFHCFVASLVFRRNVTKKNEYAALRQPAKAINFGLAYGMMVPKLYVQLMGEGYKTTMEECQKLFDTYMETFSTAVDWLMFHRRQARETLTSVNMIGRRRRWLKPNLDKIKVDVEKEYLKTHKTANEYVIHRLAKKKESGIYAGIEREGGNFQVQSGNVEWTKDAMYEIRKQCKKKGYDARMYNSVYDEIVLDVPKSCAEDVHELQKKIMIESGQRYCKRVPVEVEGHLAHCWTK